MGCAWTRLEFDGLCWSLASVGRWVNDIPSRRGYKGCPLDNVIPINPLFPYTNQHHQQHSSCLPWPSLSPLPTVKTLHSFGKGHLQLHHSCLPGGSYPLTHPVLARLDTLSHTISVRSQIGQISCTTATLETGQDPPYEALEHHEGTSQLVGTKRRSVATRYTWSKRPSKHWSFRAAVA